VREFISYTTPSYIKKRVVSAIDWLPGGDGLTATYAAALPVAAVSSLPTRAHCSCSVCSHGLGGAARRQACLLLVCLAAFTGIVGVSCCDRLNLDDRIELDGKVSAVSTRSPERDSVGTQWVLTGTAPSGTRWVLNGYSRVLPRAGLDGCSMGTHGY
jgi:hypothetical protein